MYLKRKIDEFLVQWKNNKDRLPLIVKGARQIGKTESILQKNITAILFILILCLNRNIKRY